MSSNIAEMRTEISKLKSELSSAKTEIIEMNRLLTTYVALARRAGVTGPILDLIAKFQQVRIVAETATRSIQLFYATTGPIGWLLLAGGLALSAFMMADVVGATEIRRPAY